MAPLLECHEASKHHLLEFGFFLDSTNLGFLLRENLLLYSSYLSLGVPNWVVICRHQASFLAPLPGKKKTSARGVSQAYLLLCFKFCFTLFLLALFYRKHKKISFLYSCYFITFSSSCCFLSTFWRTSQ
jgi:hypothetical protein